MSGRQTKPIERNTSRSLTMNSLLNKIIVQNIILISHMPFWMLYGLSGFFNIVLRYIVRYRKKIITENLECAFPKKSRNEISQIRNRYYRYMCDLAMESFKLYSMSEKQLLERMNIKGIDLANKYYKEGQSIIVFAFHHNNWEWCSYLPALSKHLVLMVYNPMRDNEAMEKFLAHSRGQWGGENVPVNQTARTTMKHIKEGRLTALWLAADQTAPAHSKFWIKFLKREAPFFTGPEKIAVKTNQPIFFQHVKRIKRGYYEVEYSLLIKEPAKMKPENILLKYVEKMEEIIKKEPEYYLWSHRRWKHSRPVDIPLIERNIQ